METMYSCTDGAGEGGGASFHSLPDMRRGELVTDDNDSAFEPESLSNIRLMSVGGEAGDHAGAAAVHHKAKYLSPGSPQKKNSALSNLSLMDDEEEVLVFVESPNKKLFCRICGKVFKNPVIVACGHTYCKPCVQLRAEGTCPVDEQRLVVMVANIAVSEQIGELMIHCKYGCHYDDVARQYHVDPSGCPATFRINQRNIHNDLEKLTFIMNPQLHRQPNASCNSSN